MDSSSEKAEPVGVVAPRDLRDLRATLKELLVTELALAGRDPAAITDEAPLFTRDHGGLGLDSLDALQIAMLVEERFSVRVPEGDEARPIFASIATLADFIAGAGGGAPRA